MPEPEAQVLALQRALVEAALRPDPALLEQDPKGFAAQQGLGQGDQTAFKVFQNRIRMYRDMVRGDLTDPVEHLCPVSKAFLEREGAWDACMADFLAARVVQSPHYRELPALFLDWLHRTGWGRERWPALLQLVHFEVLAMLVTRHPSAQPTPAERSQPHPGDLLELAPPTWVLTYTYQVHLATEEDPVPAPRTTHLLAYRDSEGNPQWMELTPATAALLVNAQHVPIGPAAQELGLADLSEAMELLSDLQARGAIAGFIPASPGNASIRSGSTPEAIAWRNTDPYV